MPRLVLASASPRRAHLLKEAGIAFEVRPSHVDETAPPGMAPGEVARLLAERKARAVEAGPDEWVLAADTLLDFHGTIVGKPRDEEDARRILLALSATVHYVITGVAIAHAGKIWSGIETTRVRFKALAPQAIGAYAATGEPIDKAGAYAIQGGAKEFVDRLDGPLDNVIGLPMTLTRRLLIDAGYPLPELARE